MEFDDVVNCKDVAEFNLFVRQYLAECGLVADGKHEATRRTYWALFYAWKESFLGEVA